MREQGGMQLFVAGGTGLVGSNLIRCMLRTQRDVLVTNDSNLTFACNLASTHVADFDRFEFVHDDIADRL
jgi:dTDP-D-glucose 4,6-dehydratase